MKIRRIDIENFRGIRRLSWSLPVDQTFFVLIGPGDARKSTILTALERGLSDRWNITFTDTDFYRGELSEPIRIRIAMTAIPQDLLGVEDLGLHLAGINAVGEWSHDPEDGFEECVIVELRVDADLEPEWVAYRPDADDDEERHVLRARHRSRFGTFRVDERVDAHLRWTRMSALGKLTEKKGDARKTLTLANRAAREAVSTAVPPDLQRLADDVGNAVSAIGSAKFEDLRPGLDISLTSAQGNLALFDGPVPLTNFGLGTRRLAGAAAQQLAHEDSTILLVDEVEYGLEPHRLVHLLRYLQRKDTFSQVFVTTHSPSALQHLDPSDLVMVRSEDGETVAMSLGDPVTLKPVIKASPEAFLARRVVMGEGKTEYGLLLGLFESWDTELQAADSVPTAALGVVGVEGSGGTGSAGRAKELLNAGYEVVLVLDSDDQAANALVPDVEAAGGKVVQWAGGVCTERAICDQLSAEGLTAFIDTAVEAADDPETSRVSFADQLKARGAAIVSEKDAQLDIAAWVAAGTTLEQARVTVGDTAKHKSWFKNVDRGKALAAFVLSRPELAEGAVAATLAKVREHTYYQPEPAPNDAPPEEADGTAVVEADK
ncbi:ATP-dependent nuclease [Ruania halotolerans]|uniref:ATP-dependent nuclease n=1 Tax=Ruania halotolerans TaxID=2897773 RepID=UPI001E5AFF03|nr:ATP-binding protein [Ruania halotolerans]UFU06320.1 AAA family ATPase [Ruania halotolerans]